MSHLTDTQLVILSNAARAEDGSILPVPDCLAINGGAIASVLSSLLRKGLVEERRLQETGIADAGSHATGASSYSANRAQERVWRYDEDDGNRFALAITRAGLDAIGIDAEEGEDGDLGEVATGFSRDTAPDASGGEPPDGARAVSVVPAASAGAHANVVDADTESACFGGADTGQQTAPGRAGGKPIIRPGTRQALLVELLRHDGGASLDELDLKQRWEDAFGQSPPRYMRREILVRALAHEMQREAAGGMPPGLTIKPGTRLLRDWQGVTYEVIILENGVQYRGREWNSLSAVAREITGTRWSGPLFFGLKGQRP